MLSFELTMPNVGSWNGKWTGEGKARFIILRVSKEKETELDGKNFYYDFGDGWGANVLVEKINSQEAKKRIRKNVGFAGYEWMVSEILKHGKILTKQERKQLKTIAAAEEVK